MKNIGLIPTILKRRNSLNMTIDTKLIQFLQKCFPKYRLKILFEKKNKEKLNLIVSAGGNSIISLQNNDANKYRKKLDDYYFNYSIKKEIPFLGICHGAQYIAKFFESKIIKKIIILKENTLLNLFQKKKYKLIAIMITQLQN